MTAKANDHVRDCLIVRQDNKITITPPAERQIFGCLIHTELVEHAVVFNNRTAFNDLIYDNVLGVRQDRLDVQTQRSKNWDGRYSAEGLIISSSGSVLPNFDLLVDSIRFYHDNGTQTIDPVKTDLARQLIGFEKSSSLEMLNYLMPHNLIFIKVLSETKVLLIQ